jgi:hypothetical protein
MATMPELPKIVYERLRGGAAIGAHPDPDVLAGFVEQALLPAERERVIEHLAVCGVCRQTIMVALPVSETVAAEQIAAQPEAVGVSRTSRRSWLSRPLLMWPTLRWAALAAGIMVAGTVLLQYSGKSDRSVAFKQTASEPKSAPAAQAPEPSMTQAANVGPGERGRRELKRGEIAANSEQNIPARNKRFHDAKDAESRAKSLSEGKKSPPDVRNANDKLAGMTVSSPAPQSSTMPSASETVEVTAGAVRTDEAGTLVARNEMAAPISKAKPATTEEQSAPMQKASAVARKEALQSRGFVNPLNSPGVPSRWSLSAGMLRRSQDGGVSWQNALASSQLLCYTVRDNDVWTAGKSGVLFHSADGGETWLSMHPSVADQPLSSDVTRIELRGAAEVLLSTNSGETWSTADNGKTWARK